MVMRKVEAIGVYDGACAVVSPWDLVGPVGIIDCGAGHGGSQLDAARRLASHVGDFSVVDGIAISHFDIDHWGGIKALADQKLDAALRAQVGRLGPVPLYYPFVPPPVAVAAYAMLGPASGSGSAASDIRDALATVQVPGVHVRPMARNSASPPITLGGEEYTVLWPPPFGATLTKGQRTLIRDVSAFADKLTERGFPELRDRLRESERQLETRLDDLSDETPPDKIAAAVDDEGDDDDAPHEHSIPEGAFMVRDLPAELREEYSNLRGRTQRANNNLSLVLVSKSDTLLALGDIGGRTLAAIGGRLRDRKFRVMLAPHHGTRPIPKVMPDIRWCVSQADNHHFPLQEKYHRDKAQLRGNGYAPVPHAEFCLRTGGAHFAPPR